MSPATIIAAAAFTGVTALSLGLLLICWLRLRLFRGEVLPLAFVLGSAMLSSLVFLLLTFWLAKPWILGLIGLGAIGAVVWQRAWRVHVVPHALPLPGLWRFVLRVAVLLYGGFTFIYALAPEVSPDGVAYHLGMVGRYFRAGGWEWYTGNMYANLPMGMELLFLHAYAFGRHSASALVHWQFLLALPFLVLAIARRWGLPRAGAVAALLTFLSPVVLLDGATAYVDVGAAAVTTGLFLALIAWEKERDSSWLVAVGVLAGFAYCCKMTAAPAVPFALLYVAVVLWKQGRFSLRPLVLVGGLAFAVLSPWLIKNALIVGNPFSPFLNRYFPNPNIRISFEEQYRANFRDYYGAIKSWKDIPLEVTARGGILNGYVGHIFLLTPLALLAMRWPLGRRALVAALFFAAGFAGNIGTRFLLSSLPFISLALALVLDQWRVGLPVVLMHAFLAWPGVAAVTADPNAWRLDKFRWKQAWRQEPEEMFLARMLPHYAMARLVESKVPPSGHVFAYGGVAEAYTTRDIAIAYQSGRNNVAGEILAAGVAADMVASQAAEFRFPARPIRRLRLTQTAATSRIWSVSELRLISPTRSELQRQDWWRISASPNPWDVQLAFDNCPVTRWKAWESARPGQYLQMDLVQPVNVAGVQADMSVDQADVKMRVETETAQGTWETLATEAVYRTLPRPVAVGKIVTDDLRRLGFTHLVVANDDFFAAEIFRNEKAWGLTQIGKTDNGRLYGLDQVGIRAVN